MAAHSTTSVSGCGYDSCEQYCCTVYPIPTEAPANQETVQRVLASTTTVTPIPGAPMEPTSKEPAPPHLPPPPGEPVDLPKDPKDDKDTTMGYNATSIMEEEEEGAAAGAGAGMAPPDDSPDDISRQVVNPASSRRRKRASGKDSGAAPLSEPGIISIWTDVLSKMGKNGNVTDAEYCKKPCGGADEDNYTYEIPVSVYIKKDVAKLTVTTDTETKSVLCTRSHSLDRRCSSNATSDENKDGDPPEIKQGPNHAWDLPIKYYVNNTFTIRWFMASTDTTDSVCKPDTTVSQLKEYTFIFYRNMAECGV